MRKFILISQLFIGIPLSGQNLVKNGEFEIFENCPKSYLSQKHFLPHWYSPTIGTPDYFNKCSKGSASVPSNFAGKINSENGNGYVGFSVAGLEAMFGIKGYYSREYISTELNCALKKDTLYHISFLITHALYSKICINRISVYLSKKKVNVATKRELKLTPQINFDLTAVPKGKWVLLSAVYKAQGEERFLTLGNFQSDNELVWKKTELIGNKESPYGIGAYYYIDDVVLMPLKADNESEKEFTF